MKRREHKHNFEAATRPLNWRERRERMLDRYEDSLYATRYRSSKPRKHKPAASPELASSADAGVKKSRRQVRRAARHEYASGDGGRHA